MRRPQRIAELIREGVVQIVGYELDDPRVVGVTVTDVRVSDNNRDARIFFTVAGTEAEARAALDALRHAAAFVRRQVGFSLDLPRVPLLHFVRDTVEERAARVEELLTNLEYSTSDQQADASVADGAEVTDEAAISDVEEGDAPPQGESRAELNA